MTAWVEPGEILLHIGPHKTGTTALQASFAAARPQLEELGVRYPGTRESHWHAAAAAMDRRTGGGTVPDTDRWAEVLTELTAYPDDRAFVSSELFCESNGDTAARIVAELGRPVRVAVTLRALEKLLPSTWQQAVKSTKMLTYQGWLHRVLDQPRKARWWRRFDTVALIDRWATDVGADRVCAVVLDDRSPGDVLRQYEALLGLPDGVLVPPPVTNRSMTAAETETVRQVYDQLGDALPDRLRQRWLRRGGILAMVEGYRPDPAEPRIVTPAWAVGRARELQAELNADLPGTGARIVGDPAVLVGTEPAASPEAVVPDRVPLPPVGDLAHAEHRLTAGKARVERIRARKRKVLVRKVEVPADLTKASGKAMVRELARRLKPGSGGS